LQPRQAFYLKNTSDTFSTRRKVSDEMSKNVEKMSTAFYFYFFMHLTRQGLKTVRLRTCSFAFFLSLCFGVPHRFPFLDLLFSFFKDLNMYKHCPVQLNPEMELLDM
jgi:hypothetical protein